MKKNGIKTLVFLLNLFCLIACSEKGTNNENMDLAEVWSFHKGDAMHKIAECIDTVVYLPLHLMGDAQFRSIDKLVFENGLMYIGDFHTRRIVVCDMDGNVKFVLNRLGAGEGEYQEIKSFAVTEKYIYVVDNYRRKVYMYDALTGGYEDKKDLPVTAWDIEALADGHFLLAFVPIREEGLAETQENSMIFVVDGDFNIIDSMLSFDDGYSEPYGLNRYFTTYGDSIYFTSYGFDGVTVFPKKHFKNYYRIGIDFENKLSQEERFDAEKISRSNANYLSSTPFFCGNYISVEVTEGQYGYTCIYSRKDSMFYHNPLDENESCFNVLLPPVGCWQNQLVSVAPDDYDIYRNLVDAGFERADSTVEEHIKNGGWTLLFYTMNMNRNRN